VVVQLFNRYGALKIVSILLAVFTAILTYADIDVGVFRDAGDIDASSGNHSFQMACLGISRMSAFFMYPCTYILRRY
jgi:hypothetical protein